jgi:hypothetical protein
MANLPPWQCLRPPGKLAGEEDSVMPLRDHFRPPVSTTASWEGFHAMWPSIMVQRLRATLPPGYVAEPRVHLGQPMEIDVSTWEQEAPRLHAAANGGGTATARWLETEAVLAVETDPPDEYEYEVRVYDAERGRQLVAAVEIVSPANKDRVEKRNAFIGKCAALLQKGVAVSVVDLVTARRFNLYAELRAFIGHPDPTMRDNPPITYAASCRWVPRGKRAVLESVARPLIVGQTLPTLPLWLSQDLAVPLELEQSYEQACHDLWIA